MLAASVLLVIAAVTMPFAIAHVRENVPEDRTLRFDVPMPEKAITTGTPPVISPDGRHLAFVANQGGRFLLWIRPIDSTIAQPLPGTEGADYPFWSPDSRFIAFFANGSLKKIDASGGPPQTLCPAPIPRGGAWSRNDVIVFAPAATGPLHRVAASGGMSTPVTELDNQHEELNHRDPSFLPDGRHFLFMVQGGDTRGIQIGSLDAPNHRQLLNTASSGSYAAPGYLLFVRERTLMAQRLDVDTIQLTGEAAPIAENVGTYNAYSSAFSVSDNGVVAYSGGLGGVGSDRQLAWFDRTGKQVERIGAPVAINDVMLSPDQKRAAVQWAANDIRVVDLVRGGVPSRLTFNASVEDFPVWSPTGDRVLYTSTAGGGQNVYSRIASGAGSEEVVLQSPSVKRPTDWSSNFILYEEDDSKNQADLWVLPLSGERKPRPYLRTPFAEQQARFSPDGKWVAYVSNDTGQSEVNVQSFPEGGGKWQVSTNGGVTPRWRRDGRELFYLAFDRKIMSVEVKTTGTTFDHATAKPLFEAPVDAVNTAATNRYDVSANGQRFLVNASLENNNPTSITVVVNWLAGVKAR
jgi:Tol biopolymer transport system component